MAVVNLSKWDFSFEFLLYEAAALILGIDPTEVHYSTKPSKDNPEIFDFHEHPQIKPVAERMTRDYLFASDLYQCKLAGKWPYPDSPPLQEKVLRSRVMEDIPLSIGKIEDPPTPSMLDALQTWKVEDRGIYETAKFSRTEIARWLSANGMKSVYRFQQPEADAASEDSPASSTNGRWPWGCHHTDLLGHLEAAARRYWVRYDPTDTTTAPTNATVSEWLQTERKVSRTMADAIASLLRPTGLPTGPRK